MTRPPLVRLLRLSGVPILQQLQLEEALLRATQHNWMLINDGSVQEAIVMGVSGCAQAVAVGQRVHAGGRDPAALLLRQTPITSASCRHAADALSPTTGKWRR
jgi:hypothetical protein